SGLDQGHGHPAPVFGEDPGHAQLPTQKCIDHLSMFLCIGTSPQDLARRSARHAPDPFTRAYCLISTSTPAGSTSFISASTVLALGFVISSRRLCVRLSNCSRDFLSMWGPRRTVHFDISVGSGMGPRTPAPVR